MKFSSQFDFSSSDWNELCRFFLKVPLETWRAIKIGDRFFENPECLIQVCNMFMLERPELKGLEGKGDGDIRKSDWNMAKKSRQLEDLFFEQIEICYGEVDSSMLLFFCERHFVHSVATFWWEWSMYFSRIVRRNRLRRDLPREVIVSDLISKVNHFLSVRNRRWDEISDAKIFVSDQVAQTLEGLLDREFAFEVWQKLNEEWPVSSRNAMFEWGNSLSCSMNSSLNWEKLRNYCISL